MMRKAFTSISILVLLVVTVCSRSYTFGEVAVPDGFHLVARDDCGAASKQSHLSAGSNYKYSNEEVSFDKVDEDDPARTVAFGQKAAFHFTGLRREAKYKLRLVYLSDSDQRTMRVYVDGRIIEKELKLPDDKPLVMMVDLDGEVYEDNEVYLEFERLTGPNAVISLIELYSTEPSLLPSLKVEASGDLDMKVKGRVFDQHNGKAIANTKIIFRVPEEASTLQTESDGKGLFSLRVPEEWKSFERIEVTATKEEAKGKTFVLAAELFMPSLTPCPESVEGVKECKVDLNGTWRFNPVPEDDFYKKDILDLSRWYDIEVPGEWVMQGFDVAKGTYAAYMRSFDVPADWLGHRVKLRCDAVYGESKIWVNSNQACRREGTFTPFEVDVTEFIRPGEQNQIALSVKNEVLADVLASGSQYAVHQLGGITRKIYLFAVPEVNIASLHVETVFDEEYEDAALRVCMDVSNETSEDFSGGRVQFSLYDCAEGKEVSLGKSSFKLSKVKARKAESELIEIFVTSPKKWDCEHPNLYNFTARLEAAGGTVESVSRRFGFREVEIRGNQLFVNNHPIKLHGVNRHEVHPLRGRSLTDELWRADAEIFRRGNCNYIRTSHYPPAEEFIDACDELGLFVEEEAPLCWVGHGANRIWREWDPHDIKHRETIIRAVLEMIQRDRSHPSILIWSLANESAWGPNFKKAFELANIADPMRPKSFHDQSWGDYNNFGSTTQIANYHYAGRGGPDRAAEAKRPLLFGEYCHLDAYNRHELVTDPGLRDLWGPPFGLMWERMYAAKGCLGGALWSGIDDTFFPPDGRTIGYGTWGPIDGWRREKPEYWHVKKVYSPVKILTKTIEVPVGKKPLKISVENRHDFTNFNELDIRYELGSQSGMVHADIATRSKGDIEIKVKDTTDAKDLLLTFNSPRGFMIDTFRIPIGPAMSDESPKKTIMAGELSVSEEGEVITISGADFQYEFGAKTGLIRKVTAGGVDVIIGGPELLVLPLSNEGGTQMTGSDEYEPFTDTCRNWRLDDVKTSENGEGINIILSGKYEEAEGSYEIEIDPAGGLSVRYDFAVSADINPRQTGLVFVVNRTFDTLHWEREADWSVYPDDHIGRPVGIAKAFVGTQISGSAGPRVKPQNPWSADCSSMGTNDFRSTKANIREVSLRDAEDRGVVFYSDGGQSSRAWVDGDSIRILIADYSNPGAEGFFRSHAAPFDRLLKKGDRVSGTVRLELKMP